MATKANCKALRDELWEEQAEDWRLAREEAREREREFSVQMGRSAREVEEPAVDTFCAQGGG